ncbi:hypothetical protein AB6D20_027925 (plasmid) [Vibrio splendidus]
MERTWERRLDRLDERSAEALSNIQQHHRLVRDHRVRCATSRRLMLPHAELEGYQKGYQMRAGDGGAG